MVTNPLFSSPIRGIYCLIWKQVQTQRDDSTFSSPTRGIYLLMRLLIENHYQNTASFSSPHRGMYLLIKNDIDVIIKCRCSSRPLIGECIC